MKALITNNTRKPIKILGERVEVGEEKEVEYTKDIEKLFGDSVTVEDKVPVKRKKKVI